MWCHNSTLVDGYEKYSMQFTMYRLLRCTKTNVELGCDLSLTQCFSSSGDYHSCQLLVNGDPIFAITLGILSFHVRLESG